MVEVVQLLDACVHFRNVAIWWHSTLFDFIFKPGNLSEHVLHVGAYRDPMATRPLRQCRNCSSTVSERETSQLRKVATSFCSYQCLNCHESLLFPALMGPVLLKSALRSNNHYMRRPNSAPFDNMTLLEFSRQYSMPRTAQSEPSCRNKRMVVIPRPYCSPDPASSEYEWYCCQSLMQHKSFRVVMIFTLDTPPLPMLIPHF